MFESLLCPSIVDVDIGGLVLSFGLHLHVRYSGAILPCVFVHLVGICLIGLRPIFRGKGMEEWIEKCDM
jgi:hypothetical protein